MSHTFKLQKFTFTCRTTNEHIIQANIGARHIAPNMLICLQYLVMYFHVFHSEVVLYVVELMSRIKANIMKKVQC